MKHDADAHYILVIHEFNGLIYILHNHEREDWPKDFSVKD
jgi:hypothetical protein